MGINPSKYQLDIFEFIKAQIKVMEDNQIPESLVINAGAGCGKTKTEILATEFLPSWMRVMFCAFNKHIQVELSQKVPRNVQCQTFHAFGLNAITYRFGRVKVDGNKMRFILQDLIDTTYRKLDQATVSEIYTPTLKLCGLLKNTLLEPTNDNIYYLIDRFNIEVDNSNGILYEIVKECLDKSLSNLRFIDFDDMIYLPVKLNLSTLRFDAVFVDETQDLNPAQIELLKKMVKENGFVVAVGDPFQSIYGFRGADTEAMPNLIKELNAEELPLYLSYRCGKKIVELAKTLVPQFEAFEKNPDGEIHDISYEEFYKLVDNSDMVLCRNNAPLVKPAFRLLAMGKKVAIKGRDIGEGLITLVKKFKAESMDDFFQSLDEWYEKESQKAQKRNKGSMLGLIEDKYQCLQAISEGVDTINQLIQKIESIFSDEQKEITFSSIHKAKGLEATKVYILEPTLIPSKWASKDWEVQQERNLMYVAITRAKTHLYSVGGVINTNF